MSENFFEIIDATHLKIKCGWSDTKKIASYYQIFGSALAALLKNNPHDCKKNFSTDYLVYVVWLIVIDLSGIETKGLFSTKYPTHFQSVLFQKCKKKIWSILIFAWTIFQWFSTLHSSTYFFKWRNLLLKGQELLEKRLAWYQKLLIEK